MSSGDSEARAAFRAMLSAERAGYKLSVALVSTLVSYLVGTAELSDVSELDMSPLLTTATDAWKATHDRHAQETIARKLPSLHRNKPPHGQAGCRPDVAKVFGICQLHRWLCSCGEPHEN